MRTVLERSSRVSSLFLCAVGLGLVTLTGCEKPNAGGSESAEANKPSGAGPTGDKPDPPGSPAEKKPSKPGTAAEGKPGSPSPSAGQPGSEEGATAEGKSPAPGGAKPGGGGEISDAELEKFIEVTERLRPKRKALKKELDEAKTPSEAKKAQKKVMRETRKAAEEVGLPFERFRAISRRAKADPKLQNRLRELSAAEREADKAGGGN